jgi:general secretion pathway protein D
MNRGRPRCTGQRVGRGLCLLLGIAAIAWQDMALSQVLPGVAIVAPNAGAAPPPKVTQTAAHHGAAPPAGALAVPGSMPAPGGSRTGLAGAPMGQPPAALLPMGDQPSASAAPGPQEPVRFVSLPKLSEPEIKNFINDLLLELELVKDYKRADAAAPELPKLPDKVSEGAAVLRKRGDQVDLIQFGYVMAPRRTAKLYVRGLSIGPGGSQPNPEASEALLDPLMKRVLQETARVHSRLPLQDLQARVINLSYIDADGALFGLRAMGYSAVTDDDPLAQDDSYKGLDVALLAGSTPGVPPETPPPGQPMGGMGMGQQMGGMGQQMGGMGGMGMGGMGMGSMGMGSMGMGGMGMGGMGGPRFPSAKNLPTSIDFSRLPLVVKMPMPDAQSLGLVGAEASIGVSQGFQSPEFGGGMSGGGSPMGGTVAAGATGRLSPTIAAGTSQLLVLSHPEEPEQFAKIKRVIEQLIDRPARQVYIEGLVLEVSKGAIEELGVQWGRRIGNNSLQIGSLVQLTPNAGQAALDFTRDTAAAAFDPQQFLAKINALVDRSKAEILSRPSVLTLDNRQAYIRVGTDIPIATSKDSGSSSESGGRVSFSFQYLPTGILLNVRPRITEDGREISMLIDATVSAPVPGQDLRVIDPTSGRTLASAPTISQRRVQTYARITNNTPLIIGGLVSRDQTSQEDKVPGLADLPLLGKLFGYQSKGDARREVIIVLTPSVLTEEFRATKPQLPKDDDRFDQAGTSLFRESYRIRAEDLIDSQYLRSNRRLSIYRALAQRVIEVNPDMEKVAPFSLFASTKVPGEFAFVSGMMSRMLKRLKTADPISIDSLNYFEGVEGAAFQTESVGGLLKRLGDGSTHESFFQKNPGKALTLRFKFGRGSIAARNWVTEPMAVVQVVDCVDRTAWRKLLWQENQPEGGVQTHYTLVIQDASDLERLKRAIALKNTILNNGGEPGTRFDNFLPGRMLAMQAVTPEWERVLEATVARYFFFGEFFLPAAVDAMEAAILQLDTALRKPGMTKYLDGMALP